MKRFLCAFAVVALLAACSKTASTTSSGTSDAAATAAGAAASAAATTGATTSSGAPFVAIELPVYPGATKEPDKSISMNNNGSSVKIDYYASSDGSDTVVAWYKAHLPADWQNFTISSGPKTAGTFSSPDHGNDGQAVIVTGEDKGGSQIQLSTKTGG